MPITFTAGRDIPAGAVLAVPVFTGLDTPPGSPAELDRSFLEARGFKAKVGETLALLADDGGVVLAVGVGAREKVDAETIRKAAAAVVRGAGKAVELATSLLDAAPGAAAALAEGAALAAYSFDGYKTDASPSAVERVTVLTSRAASVQRQLDRGARIAVAVATARDWVNEPAGALTPARLAERAVALGQATGLRVEVLDERRIEAERLGGLRGVSLGSDQPPRLIKLTYEPERRPAGTLALVGKGITFDSGGLSIKTADGMVTMKTDMGGGAAVIAAMSALRDLGCRSRVVGYVPATENMPGGRAVKPGDVLRARNGKTIEVLNTDAEGRLVLADGLSLAVEGAPDAIVDVATLTGAQVVALGRKIAALMGNHDGFVDQVRGAADRAGEPVWPLPLPDEYRSHMDSEIADMKNIGAPGQAGTLIGGLFLKEFVGDVPWAHLDIAGPARSDADEGYFRKGGTGFGVRTLIELALTFRRPAQPLL